MSETGAESAKTCIFCWASSATGNIYAHVWRLLSSLGSKMLNCIHIYVIKALFGHQSSHLDSRALLGNIWPVHLLSFSQLINSNKSDFTTFGCYFFSRQWFDKAINQNMNSSLWEIPKKSCLEWAKVIKDQFYVFVSGRHSFMAMTLMGNVVINIASNSLYKQTAYHVLLAAQLN